VSVPSAEQAEHCPVRVGEVLDRDVRDPEQHAGRDYKQELLTVVLDLAAGQRFGRYLLPRPNEPLAIRRAVPPRRGEGNPRGGARSVAAASAKQELGQGRGSAVRGVPMRACYEPLDRVSADPQPRRGVRWRLGRTAAARRERRGHVKTLWPPLLGYKPKGPGWESMTRVLRAGWVVEGICPRTEGARDPAAHLVHDHRRLAGADGSQRSFAGLVHRELAIERG